MATKLQMVPRRIWLQRKVKISHLLDIELKFGIETKCGPLSSKSNKNVKFDVIKTSLSRFWLLDPYIGENTQMTSL